MTSADSTPVPDYPGLLRLDRRRFVVVGAGLGIGRQTAHALSAAGARVACVDVEADRAHDVASEVGGVAVVGDATRRPDAERVFDAATDALGGLDGVVDIVGMARYSTLLEIDDDEWDWHFDIVLRHAYLAVQLGGRRLAAGSGGVLAFVASVSGLTSAPRHAAYGAAKAALMALVRSAAVELGPVGVRVNAVAPGVVWTPRVSAILGEEGRARNAANTPIRRVAEPADIAAALLFLCSDLAAYVTGQTLVVDGGVGAKFPYPMAD
jgi:NAD(P)-dependent dehydrogenase (short-subunit alcohol dehydrogenase family)